MSSTRPTRIRSSLALATPCLLAFVIAAVGKWCSNCTCAQHIGIKAARGEEVIACDAWSCINERRGETRNAARFRLLARLFRSVNAKANVAQRHAAVLLHPCVSRVGPHAAHHRPPPSNMSYAQVADRLTEALRTTHLVLLLNVRDGLAHHPHCGVALAQAAAGGTPVARLARAPGAAARPRRRLEVPFNAGACVIADSGLRLGASR